MKRRCLLCVLAVMPMAAPASAQSRVEIGAAVSWTVGFDAGGRDAQLTRNPSTGSFPFTLFDTTSHVHAAPGFMATLGYFVTRRLALDAVVEYSRPTLATTISSDAEAATGAAADSRLTSVVIGGSARYHFGASRTRPFLFAGAGWLRQLDEDNVMLVTGPEVHGGFGTSYRLDRHFALRGQGGVSIREKTIAFEEKWRIQPQLSGGLTYHW